jgi:apolipoprotein N-acyltransferase
MSEETHKEAAPSAAASLFDLRTVIALLFGVYGVLLLIIALVNSTPEQLAKSGGIHLNLWAAIIMLVLAAGFFAWVRLRPPVTTAPDTGDGDGPGAHH